MKRISLIVLTFIYLFSCVGVGAERLYCCGKLSSVSFSYGAGDHVNKQADTKNKCCKTERLNFKIKDNHVSSTTFELAKVFPANTIVLSWLPFRSPVKVVQDHANQSNAPPGPDISLCILNCNYRI